MKTQCLTTSLCLTLFAVSANSQIGVFDRNVNIGEVVIEGNASFDNGTYIIEAVGNNIGRQSVADSFNFMYKEMTGSFALSADTFPIGDIGEAGVMIRGGLEPDDAHGSLLILGVGAGSGTGDFSALPHIRSIKGGGTIVDGDPEPAGYNTVHTGPFRLERLGNSIHLYTFNDVGEWQLLQSEAVLLGETVYAGIAAVAKVDDNFAEYEVSGVEITEFPLNVMRSIPSDDVQPNSTLQGITVTASVRDGMTSSAVVTEIVPIDGALANVQASAGDVTVNGATITWTLSGLSGDATLTYDLALGPRPAALWKGTFNDGEHEVSYIGGDQLLPKVPTMQPLTEPVELDPDNPVIIQAEHGRFFYGDEEEGWALFFNAETENGIALLQINAQLDSLLEFPINIPEGYGDLYIFASFRSDDGNSDSWFFDVEVIPSGNNDLQAWDPRPIAKAFVRDWGKNRQPDGDPRAFTGLTAGENYIYFSGREDSIGLDWIAVTNDPTIDIDAFPEVTGTAEPPVAVQEYMLY